MNDQNPYQSPGETELQRPSGFAFRWGSWTVVFWVLAVLVAISLFDWVIMELGIRRTRIRRDQQRKADSNAAPIVGDSK